MPDHEDDPSVPEDATPPETPEAATPELDDGATVADVASAAAGPDGDTDTDADDAEAEAEADDAEAGDAEKRMGALPILIAVGVTVLVVAGLAFLLLSGGESQELKASLTLPGTCDTGGLTLEAAVTDGAEQTLGSGPVKLKATEGNCEASWAFPVEPADQYQMQLKLTNAEEAADPATLTGPTFTQEELEAQDFTVTLKIEDFAPAAPAPTDPSAPTSGAPAPDAEADAQDTEIQTSITTAMATATNYYKENKSFAGLTGEELTKIDPSVSVDEATTATEGQVSLRDVQADTIVLVGKSASGAVFCMGRDASKSPTQGDVFGIGDAPDFAACAASGAPPAEAVAPEGAPEG